MTREKPTDIFGSEHDLKEESDAERSFIMSDKETFGHQDNRASDYEYGMGSGRPASEGEKGEGLGLNSGDHHQSKMKELLDDAGRMLHMEKRGKKD